MKPPRHSGLFRASAIAAALLAWNGLVLGAGNASTAERGLPNIVLILADDLGWADLGCYGADLHETPHLDRLAAQGVRFTQAYAPAPVCSPTRAALLTGKAPARLRITVWAEGSLKGPTNRLLLQGASRHDLSHVETTIATLLRNAGYLTALVGKWHLGGASHFPETHGFDVNIGGTHWGSPSTFFWPYRGRERSGELRYVPHLEFGTPGEYLTDRLTDEALRVIDHAAAERRPFFLYLAHHAPHTPIEAKPAEVARFEAKVRPGMKHQHPVYAAMVASLDESVGRVLSRLRDRGLEKNTLVVFTSDNGGYLGRDSARNQSVTSNAPLRSGKGTLYEGGLRIPLIVRWPGIAHAGEVCRTPVVLTDLFHTLAEAAHVRAPGSNTLADGLDLGALLREPRKTLERDALYFHYPHYYHAPASTPASAVRANGWKLIEFFEDERMELFNLDRDQGEERDVAAENPELVAELRRRLNAWRASVGAALPSRNPDFKSAPK